MTEKIPEFVLSISEKLELAGFESFIVGGSVRDMFLKRPLKDWDLATNAKPEEILKIFQEGFYDNSFGTVGIPVEIGGEKHVIEITTYRTEQGYTDNRRPDNVSWGTSVEEDLKRRDFTVNAIALKVKSDNTSSVTVVDPYDGQADLVRKLIRAVGNPDERFQEDGLRLMRALRLSAQLSFEIEEETLKALKKNAKLILNISSERIRDELMKILASDNAYEGVMLLYETGLLQYILPELLEGVGVSQERPGRHHKHDVFTHNVNALRTTPSKDPLVRFATLIHDIGKPRVQETDAEGYVIFHNHEMVGAKMAEEICDRLRFSKKQREKVVTLIRWHMFTVDEHTTDAAIRRFIRRVGVENIKDMIDLRIGDRLGSGTETAESWRLKLFKKRLEEQLAPAPFSIKDLAIDGNDIMKELSLEPGPKIGEILEKLFEEVDEDLSKNNKEYLLKRVSEIS